MAYPAAYPAPSGSYQFGSMIGGATKFAIKAAVVVGVGYLAVTTLAPVIAPAISSILPSSLSGAATPVASAFAGVGTALSGVGSMIGDAVTSAGEYILGGGSAAADVATGAALPDQSLTGITGAETQQLTNHAKEVLNLSNVMVQGMQQAGIEQTGGAIKTSFEGIVEANKALAQAITSGNAEAQRVALNSFVDHASTLSGHLSTPQAESLNASLAAANGSITTALESAEKFSDAGREIAMKAYNPAVVGTAAAAGAAGVVAGKWTARNASRANAGSYVQRLQEQAAAQLGTGGRA